MSRGKVLALVGVVAVATLVWTGASMAQERGGGRARGGGGRWDPERMREMMMQRVQESLGATDEEWQVIGPRLGKVMTLSREARGGRGMGALFGRGRWGGRPAAEEDEPEEEQTAIEQATDGLQAALEDEAATAEQVKQKLSAYRAAREQARQELAAAQQELREVLSVRQEARLVLFGMLE